MTDPVTAGTTPAIELALEPVGTADFDALFSYVRAYWAYDGHAWDETTVGEAVLALTQGTPYARAWFVRLDGRRIGYASVAYGFSIEVGGLDFFLDEIFVEEVARGGLGRRLLALVEAECRRLGARRLCLEAELHNARAKALYEGSGYQAHERHLLSKRLV